MGESYTWLGMEMMEESEISNFCFIHFRIVSFVTLKIIYNFKIKYRMFHKVSKLLLHFERWSVECRPEKPHGLSRPLSSLDEEKSQDGSRT